MKLSSVVSDGILCCTESIRAGVSHGPMTKTITNDSLFEGSCNIVFVHLRLIDCKEMDSSFCNACGASQTGPTASHTFCETRLVHFMCIKCKRLLLTDKSLAAFILPRRTAGAVVRLVSKI